MHTTRRALAFACVLAFYLASSSGAGASASVPSAVAPSTLGLQAGGHLSRAEESAPVTRQAYDALFDRFVASPSSGDLLQAAAAGALEAARVKPGEWPEPRFAFDGSRDGDWQRFEAWFEVLARLAAPELDRTPLERAAVAAMARSLNESHTRYLTPAQYQDHLAWTRGDVRYIGVGLRMRGATPTVAEVFEGSPAEAAGLRVGDVIVAIDGRVTEGAREAAVGQLRGPQGAPVELVVRRHGVVEPLSFTLVRDEIAIRFVRSRVVEDKLGYLRVQGFPEPGIDDEVARALAGFETAGIDGLVLDLRGNSGGRLDVGVRVASRLVKDGVIFQQVDRAGQRRLTGSNGSHWGRAVSIVALIDEGTASMGELLASALQETNTARLIGARTSGSVAGALTVPLVDGSGLRITVLEIVSGKGVTLNRVGVSPDQAVEMSVDDLRLGRDSQLEAALAYLRAQAAPPVSTGWGGLAPAA